MRLLIYKGILEPSTDSRPKFGIANHQAKSRSTVGLHESAKFNPTKIMSIVRRIKGEGKLLVTR